MEGGGLEGEDECDVIEVGKDNHFYLLEMLIFIVFMSAIRALGMELI